MNKNKKAFTLVELLVVVLIIGILAAIAVPQYQVAVMKSKYSTLKAKTKAIAEAINRYELATGKIPEKFGDLDISFPNVEGDTNQLSFPNGEWCYFWTDGQNTVACFLKDRKMGYYFKWKPLMANTCYSLSNNTAGLKVCAQETGKIETPGDSYTVFSYY